MWQIQRTEFSYIILIKFCSGPMWTYITYIHYTYEDTEAQKQINLPEINIQEEKNIK